MFRLTGLYCASNPPLCVVNVNGGLKTHNVRVEVSTRCFQYTASSERGEPRSLRKRWLRWNGTSHVPYGIMASPERDAPRSLRNNGFAGTGRAAFPTE